MKICREQLDLLPCDMTIELEELDGVSMWDTAYLPLSIYIRMNRTVD